MKSFIVPLFVLLLISVDGLLPPKFQWKILDFAWKDNYERNKAINSKDYIPESNMPTGLVKWKDRLFITIPRWKNGVPSSLNYVDLYGNQSEPLTPYPDWESGFVKHDARCINSESTVVSAFRPHVDKCGRLWVADNGVADMARDVKQIAEPAVVIFDLETDQLIKRFPLPDDVLRDSTVMTSIVVDIVGKGKRNDDTYAYITDMGSNAIIVYHMKKDEAWRVEHPFFHFDPLAGVYNVGGVEFYWNDGVSAAALSPPMKDGHRYLYMHPTSSTKQFRVSTKFLRDKNTPKEDVFSGVEVVGDRGPKSQATACDFDEKTNVLFFTQLSKNGVGCWHTAKSYNKDNTPLIISDCNMLEFPNDIKVDDEGNLWILSDRQSRFLYESMDFSKVNFRILTGPVDMIIEGSNCTPGGKGKKSKDKKDKSEKKAEKERIKTEKDKAKAEKLEKKSSEKLEKINSGNLEKKSSGILGKKDSGNLEKKTTWILGKKDSGNLEKKSSEKLEKKKK